LLKHIPTIEVPANCGELRGDDNPNKYQYCHTANEEPETLLMPTKKKTRELTKLGDVQWRKTLN
jgi:hypothetical protein